MRRLRPLVLATSLACRASEDARPHPPVEQAPRPPPIALPAPRPTSSDVTFLVVSDTHFGFAGIERTHDALVSTMSSIAGARGVVVTGDLTEWGKREQWERFLA